MCLQAALVDAAPGPLKNGVRHFLNGLSSDELAFIAEYLGSCILEGGTVADYPCKRRPPEDYDLKMILLFEYLEMTSHASWNTAS